MTFEAFIDGKPYAEKAYVEDPVRFGAMPRSIPYIQGTREPVENMRHFIRGHEEELDCIDVVVKSEEYKRQLWKTLEKQVRHVYITSSVKQLLEISDINAGKDAAAQFLIGYLGMTREELAGFGDGHNDCGLLAFAGIGFAMTAGFWHLRESGLLWKMLWKNAGKRRTGSWLPTMRTALRRGLSTYFS